jgi:hypothetical protein
MGEKKEKEKEEKKKTDRAPPIGANAILFCI